MTDKIVLKETPLLEFIFNDKSFVIINHSDQQTEGKYNYSEIILSKYNKRKTNWFWTIFSYLFDFWTGAGGGGDIYQEKKKLHMKTIDKDITIDLFDCEQILIDKLFDHLRKRVNHTST